MANKLNYFTLFDLPMTLPVDVAALTATYQRLQRQFHPDNYALCPDTQRQAILTRSADINQAYQTLKDPIRSAEYFLSLHGVEFHPEKNITHDPIFLQEQFMLREHLDSLEHLEDPEIKEHHLVAFKDQIKLSWDDTYNELLDALLHSNWSVAMFDINKLRFLRKIQQDIDRLEDQLFDL